MVLFRVAFVLHNTLKKSVFTFTRFTSKTPKTLENKGKSNIFKGSQICRLRDLNPHGVATNGF